MKRIIIVSLSLSLIFAAKPSYSKKDVVCASYKYIMGDNDTKNDAKWLCFMGAKRRLLEKIGTFIISKSVIENFKLTKDEIISYSAAFINVEVKDEKIAVVGETSEITITLKANVDIDEVRRNIDAVVNDKSLQKEVEQQNEKILQLENRIRMYQQQLATSDYEKSFQLRKERIDAFQSLDFENERIRRIILSKRKRDVDRSRKVELRAKQVRAILKHVELGMTPEEVGAIINEISGDNDYTRHQDRYGHIWKWDKMRFRFSYDEVLDLRCLYRITLSGYYLSGITLKDKDMNILNMPKIQTAYRKWLFEVYYECNTECEIPDEFKFMKSFSYNSFKDQPGLCVYVWGKECNFTKGGRIIFPDSAEFSESPSLRREKKKYE